MKRQKSANATGPSPKRYFSPTQHNFNDILKSITQNIVNVKASVRKVGQSPNPTQKRVKTQLSTYTVTKHQSKQTSSVPKSKLDNFTLFEQIGSGKFGKVYRCQQNTSKKIYALKMINKQQLKQSKMMHQLERELSIHSSLKHPNIIQMYEYFETPTDYCLLLEYANQGSLFSSLVKQPNQRFSEPTASKLIRQVALGIQYLQRQNIIHRDLKPENILNCEGVLKIADFGWSIRDKKERETLCGTIDYLPPEMVYGQQYDNSVDLWSLGILTYEMTTGLTPFQIQEGFDLHFPNHLSGDVKDLIQGLLTEKKLRKSIDWVLNHIWLN